MIPVVMYPAISQNKPILVMSGMKLELSAPPPVCSMHLGIHTLSGLISLLNQCVYHKVTEAGLFEKVLNAFERGLVVVGGALARSFFE